jgi:hypothetical protein
MPDPQSPAEPTTDEAVEKQPIENIPGENKFGESEQGDPKYDAEYGGPKGREPNRYGDWEKNGRCLDFELHWFLIGSPGSWRTANLGIDDVQ